MEPIPVMDARFRERVERSKLNFNKQSVSLKKHFMALLMKRPKVIGTDDCRRILRMLSPNFKSLNDMELSRLGQVLRYYVKAYPCWDDFAVIYKDLNKSDEEKYIYKWFTQFTKYLTLKMEDAWEISEGLKDYKSGLLAEKQTQTDLDHQPNTTNSGYSIELEGPPNLTYSTVFNISNGDVVAGKHFTTPFSIEKYETKCRFINLPYVSVQAKFADVSFERKNVHEIERFITMRAFDPKKNYSKYVKVERINEDEEVQVYTLHLYTMYFRQFMQILRSEPSISDIRKLEYKIVIEEILKDMEEALVCSTMPTNARVTFTIGDNIYIRNKQTATRDINYYEIITPKVALSMHHFNGEQNLSDNHRITFKSLNVFEKNRELFIEHMNSCRLVFECLLCTKSFLSLFTIQSHFREEHREEHAVMCGSCRKEVKVAALVGNRWRHRCKSSQEV